jgi:hypothetical protein
MVFEQFPLMHVMAARLDVGEPSAFDQNFSSVDRGLPTSKRLRAKNANIPRADSGPCLVDPDDVEVPSFQRRIKCSKCGRRGR